MPESCLFCRIARGEVPADVVYEDSLVVAFKDIQPQAPTHMVLIPRAHVETLNDLREEHDSALASLHHAAAKIARDQGVDQSGYRLVLNCGEDGGQSVFHVHMHLLGGRSLAWPPG